MLRRCLPVLLLLYCLSLGRSQQPLINAVWVDRPPGDPHQPSQACWFGMDGQGMLIDAASSYKSTLEAFYFGADGTQIQYRFPHDQRQAVSGYRIEPFLTDHFDARLTLSADPLHQGRPYVYYTGPEFR